MVEHQCPVAYAYRGLSLDSEGSNRNVNVAIPTVAGRQRRRSLHISDPDVLPGQTDVAAPDGPNNEMNTGYLWDAALRAGLTVRNYGFFIDVTRYSTTLRQPFLCCATRSATGTDRGLPHECCPHPVHRSILPRFRQRLPDYYRYTEWAREFDANYANGGLPALSLVRFMHDHTGNFELLAD